MPKFFAKIPFWIWPIIGLVCLMLSVPGFLLGEEKKARQLALASPTPELIDLEDFDADRDIGVANEVNVFAQTNPDYRFLIDRSGVATGASYVVPLFSAMSGPKEKSVSHVLLVRELEEFEIWLKNNVSGTARMGNLYEVNGEVVDGRGFTAAIRVTLRDAGLAQVDPLVIIKPFVAGRSASLNAPSRSSYGNPYILAASGVWMIWFGFVVGSRAKQYKYNVSRRIGEIGDRSAKDGVNRSRLKRTSQILATGAAPSLKIVEQTPQDPSATPAE